jgi:hypothetical protein
MDKKFKNNLPGRDWFECFMKRNEQLTVKLAENTKMVRATVTYDMIANYLEELANDETMKPILLTIEEHAR